jgi:hypothetical protein
MIFTNRKIGMGMLLIGCFGYIHGVYQLFSGQLLLGQGKHPWLKGFFEAFLGNHAFLGGALVSILIGSAFIYMGVKGVIHPVGRAKVHSIAKR